MLDPQVRLARADQLYRADRAATEARLYAGRAERAFRAARRARHKARLIMAAWLVGAFAWAMLCCWLGGHF